MLKLFQNFDLTAGAIFIVLTKMEQPEHTQLNLKCDIICS
jgi:hypothetical protein